MITALNTPRFSHTYGSGCNQCSADFALGHSFRLISSSHISSLRAAFSPPSLDQVMASSSSATQIASTGQYSIYVVLGLVVQTFFFGVYTVLIVLSTRMLLKRGLKTRSNKVMFMITLFMYLLSAAYWAYSVADVVDQMRNYIDDLQNPLNYSATHDTVTKWSPLFNAIVLVNYILSDAVIVWRAWILCLRNHRKYLCITMFFLVLTTTSVTCTIIFRIIALIEAPFKAQFPNSSYLVQGINILQISNLGMSLISNFSATAVVGVAAWRHRQSIRAAFADNKKRTKADQVLALLVESGLLYCVSGLTVLVASLIRLPKGTLGDLYNPINVQIAGAYTPVVLLLVSMQRSLTETTFLNTFEGSAPSRPIQFNTASNTNSGHQNRSSAAVVSVQFARNPAELSRTAETDAMLYSNPQASEKI
ncbi:hypothetical protein C8R44DRAFT_247011 [Mycena epipterygia]|nr:hypothetical protein C8R44DRAFT_247011 [Mycena epipterygia]